MKKQIYLVIALILVIMLLFALSNRVHALATTANTVITSPTYNYEITFRDVNLVQQPTFNPTVPLNSTPVTSIFGLVTAVDPSQVTRSVRAGLGTTLMTQEIRSRSNPPLGVTINFSHLSFVQKVANIGNPGNWTVTSNVPRVNGVFFNQTGIFTLQVTSDASARYASVATVTVNYALSGHQPSHVVNYTGFNSESYGGTSFVPVLLTFTVQGPNLVVLNSSTAITAPPGFTGNPNASVPGAKITYQNVIQNSGNVTANSISVDQAIPVNTTFFGIPAGGDEDSVQYKIAGVFGAFSAPSSNVQAVRFNKTEIAAGEIVTLNFTVTVN